MLPYCTSNNVEKIAKQIVADALKEYTPGGGGADLMGPFEVIHSDSWMFKDEQNTPDVKTILADIRAGKRPCLHLFAQDESSGNTLMNIYLDLAMHREGDDEGSGSGSGSGSYEDSSEDEESEPVRVISLIFGNSYDQHVEYDSRYGWEMDLS